MNKVTNNTERCINYVTPVDDAHRVEVAEGQGELRQVELDIVLREHHLLGQPGEEVATPQEVQDQVQLALRLQWLNDVRLTYIFSLIIELLPERRIVI